MIAFDHFHRENCTLGLGYPSIRRNLGKGAVKRLIKADVASFASLLPGALLLDN